MHTPALKNATYELNNQFAFSLFFFMFPVIFWYNRKKYNEGWGSIGSRGTIAFMTFNMIVMPLRGLLNILDSSCSSDMAYAICYGERVEGVDERYYYDQTLFKILGT